MLPAFSAGSAAAAFIIVGMLMLCFVLLLSWCVRPLRERQRGQETYECGFKAQGDARAIGFNYLQYAVLFLIFDVAALYLFLFAVMPRMPATVAVSFLLGIATLGLMILYGTKKRRYHVA